MKFLSAIQKQTTALTPRFMKQFLKCLGLSIAVLAFTPIAHSNDDPANSISNLVSAIKNNDLAALIRISVGVEEFDNMGQQWEEQRSQRKAEITESERAEFSETIGMVIATDAEQRLMSLVEPKLAEYQAGLMQMVALFQGLGAMQIQQSPDLNTQEKQNLTAALNKTAQWVTANDLTNKEKMQQAIAILVTRARSMNITSIDDVMNLNYEDVLSKGGVALATARDILQHYNVEVNTLLDSVAVETLENDGKNAIVSTKFEIFGIPQEVTTRLVKYQGNWVSEDAVAQAKLVSALASMPRTPASETVPAAIPTNSDSATTSITTAMEQLQDSLNTNPFLSRAGINLSAIELADGFATLEVRTESSGIMSAIQDGNDLLTMDPALISASEDKQSLIALRKALQVLGDRYNIQSFFLVPGA